MARGKKPHRKQRLTELFVRKARPQSKAYLVWDAVQRGLALRVQPGGMKAWLTVYSRHGRSRWLTHGPADAIGLADARLLAAKTMVAVAEGKDPAADRKAARSAGTFADLAERYVQEHARKHNKSWTQAKALIDRNVLPRWGKLQAASIARDDVKALMVAMEAAPISANQSLAAVSAIFTWAMKEQIVTANPCKMIERNPTKDRERILAELEIGAFWKAFDDTGLVTSTALKVLLLTGQRPGEVVHMRREHIVDGGWWELPGGLQPGWPGTKNGNSHRVWLSKPVQAMIAELGDGGETTGPVFAHDKLAAAMRAICRQLGVKDKVTPHDLRRTFGSKVTGLGFGRRAMDRLLNHADNSVGSIYDRHGYAVEDKHIMESVASHILGLAEGRTDDDGKVVALLSR